MTPFQTGLELLLRAFRELEIPYLIGGSVASSFHGIPRATIDIDFLAAIALRQVPAFAAIIGTEFIAFDDDISEAIRRRQSFNLILRRSGEKFDIFPAQNLFHREQLRRAPDVEMTFGGLKMAVKVASPEDVLLSKLLWFRQGGEVSDYQWRDIAGVVSAQAGKLDLEYLNRWANDLEIADLLARALR